MTDTSLIPELDPPSSKGVPARESRTGPRLVSPATGCEKKKRTPRVDDLGSSD